MNSLGVSNIAFRRTNSGSEAMVLADEIPTHICVRKREARILSGKVSVVHKSHCEDLQFVWE